MRHEFKVVLEDIDLSPEQQKEIRAGIQRVVMRHLAESDLGGDRNAAVLALSDGNGGTQGIVGRIVAADEAKELLGPLGQGGEM
jgi:hypothetical protein